ncbi:hypothetical protein [Winogradskyella sp. A2]|uniref:hypothetical protein n=1 Tax=Winogradskyella sp. A2 TaxID=3366944 RepID=UPI00398C3C9C
MTYILKNKTIELHIDNPLENYNFSRFDWTGKIKTVKYKGLLVTGDEKTDPMEIPHFGRGFYNEFGIDSPIGYQNLKQDDWFHKIGVGLLKKEESEYFFMKKYEIQPANFEVNVDSENIHCTCESKLHNGYSYLLEKEIRLSGNGFIIKYYLKNTGKKTIITNEYVHNFMSINKALISEDYKLILNFNMNPQLFRDTVNPDLVVTFEDNKINFKSKPKSDFFFSNLSGGKLVDAQWKLENLKNNIGISEKGDFKTNTINLWGTGHVISPELFIDINLKAGASKSWTRTYTIYELT